MLKVHFMGIGGSGASAVAAIAQSQGYLVSGCDKNPHNEFTSVFQSENLYQGHHPDHLKEIDLLAISPAITSLDPNNNEIIEAKQKGIPVLTWQQFMGQYLEQDKFVIAICGTHGKSTTTAMIGEVLEDANLNPTVELGAIDYRWTSNFRLGEGQYFVTEADEFNDNFLSSTPDIAVVTTIEMDHPEYFKDFEAYKESFKKFLGKTKQRIIANLEDPGVREVVSELSGISIIDYSQKPINFPLQIIGDYNKKNAAAVFQVGLSLGINPESIQQSLMKFQGIRRRFEHLGQFQDAQVYSDFGHHPTELKVTLDAIRQKYPAQRLITIFQPHMFSRTYALFDQFVDVLRNSPSNFTYILDIYPSREVDTGLVSSKQLIESINKYNVKLVTPKESIFDILKNQAQKGDIIIFLGAGDIHELGKKLSQIKST